MTAGCRHQTTILWRRNDGASMRRSLADRQRAIPCLKIQAPPHSRRQITSSVTVDRALGPGRAAPAHQRLLELNTTVTYDCRIWPCSLY